MFLDYVQIVITLKIKMKDLRFKLDILGGLVVTFGALCLVFGPLFTGLWILDASGVIMIIGFIIFSGSTWIANFIKRKR